MRENFPILQRKINGYPLVYLDNAATTQKPASVINAMNDYYLEKWSQVRQVEGASQRIQEDTMRFSGIMQGLGVAMVDSVMTLISFLPVLSDHQEQLTLSQEQLNLHLMYKPF